MKHPKENDSTPKTRKRMANVKLKNGTVAMTRRGTALMRQFQTVYNGETVDIEPHITFAKESQSIHFGRATDGRIIIGSCGPHKEIYSSRKNK